MRYVIVGGEKIRLEFRDEEDDPELESSAAYFDEMEGLIVIDKNYCVELRWHILGHEIGHAVWRHTGMHRHLKKLGLTGAQADDIEESVCEHFTPSYLDTLHRNNWIKVPVIK